ncbi:MAG: FAD:protein FMN transferase [Pseudomonadota bacterium]
MSGGSTRRRFLTLSAAALAAPGAAFAARDRTVTRWRGVALGAEAEVTLRGPREGAEAALAAVRAALEEAEALFSLYCDDSVLARLNREGRLAAPPRRFIDLLALANRVWRATDGRFDPTVQPLWRALATGGDAAAARAKIGWGRVSLGSDVQLGEGQALTLNGIAQGFATDMAAEALAAYGYAETLTNIGEFRAGTGDWRVGVADPEAGLLRTARLSGTAIATSSPGATRVGGSPHIFGPSGEPPRWSTVAVEARTAALADAASTAFCLMDTAAVERAMARLPEIRRVTLAEAGGDFRVVKA